MASNQGDKTQGPQNIRRKRKLSETGMILELEKTAYRPPSLHP